MADNQAEQLNKADLTGEFVTGGNSWLSQDRLYLDHFAWGFPWLTHEARERLKNDSEVKASLSLLADSVLADGIAPVPAVTDENDPEFVEAKEIADFVVMAVGEATRSLTLVYKEMFKAAFLSGVKVGEKVFKEKDGWIVLDRVNPKPNWAIAFVCDRFKNVLGLIGANASAAINIDDIISRDKFTVLAFELEDNDPRGVAEAKAIIESWCNKRDTGKQWKEWRRTSAIPKKVGITGQNQQKVPLLKDGAQVLENGAPKTVSPEKALMNALERFENNSSITAPFGTDIKQLEVQGTGQQFINAIKYDNSQIRKVILGDSLTTGEADKDARAARESAKDVTDIRKQSFRQALAETIKRDIFRLLTVLNFGEDKAHLTPNAFLGDTEANDWATDVTAAGGVGYSIADEHLPVLDKQFGLPPRKVNEGVDDPADPNNSNNQDNTDNQGNNNQNNSENAGGEQNQ